MGFHRRFITNQHVIDLFEHGGINEVIKAYTSGADVIITDAGISSDILNAIKRGTNVKSSILELIQREVDFKLENRT
jgi:hypothetical protein